jgi:hypothetical protein
MSIEVVKTQVKVKDLTQFYSEKVCPIKSAAFYNTVLKKKHIKTLLFD